MLLMPAPVHFEDLDDEVKEFLLSLDKEKVSKLNEAVRFYDASKTVSKFLRICLYTTVAIFITTAALGEAIQKIWGWVTSTGGPK